MRETFKDAFFKKHGVKLGFMSAFVRASVCALQEQPIVNAVLENTDIVHRNYVDISVAVATPKVRVFCESVCFGLVGIERQGLVVPVLRHCESMGFADVEKSIAALGEKVCFLC